MIEINNVGIKDIGRAVIDYGNPNYPKQATLALWTKRRLILRRVPIGKKHVEQWEADPGQCEWADESH